MRASTKVWWVVAGLSVATATWLHIAVAWHSAKAPRTPWDENVILQMARLIAGDDSVAQMSGSGYYPGWAFVLAPIWWFTDDPAAVYQSAVIIGIVIALATIAPLTLIGRHLGLGIAQSVSVAGILMCLPTRTILADYSLSEQLLTFCIAWAIAAAFAVWRRPTAAGMLLFVLAVVAAYFTHARAITLVLTALVWLLCFLRRRVATALIGLAGLGIGYVVVEMVARAITSRILVDGFGKAELMTTALSTTTPELLLRVALSQTWAQLVSTFGLAAVGGVVVVIWTIRELRRWIVGPAGFVFGLTVSSMLISFMWWSGERFLLAENPRFDVWVYTRYIDPVMLFVVLFAVAAILRQVSRPIMLASLGTCAAIMLPVILWVAPTAPTWGAYRGPGNAAGVLMWRRLWPTGERFDAPLLPSLDNANRFWLIASLAVLVFLLVLLVLRRWTVVLTAVLLITFAVSSLVANPAQSRNPPRSIVAAYQELEQRYGYEGPILFDTGCETRSVTRDLALNWIAFWASPRLVDLVDSETESIPHGAVVMSCEEWEAAGELGARAVKNAHNHQFRVWILPGALQDALATDDRLGAVPTR